MPTSAEILTLCQWLSPAYPVGAFAYSHGLESAVATGRVTTGPALEDWLHDVLHYGSGRADALFLAAAYAATTKAELARIDAAARAFCPSRERALETDAMGAAFVRVTGAVWPHGGGATVYPVALGRAAACQGIARQLTAEMYLQAFLSNLIAAGQRLLPLGQTAAQAMLRDLTPDCIAVAADTGHGRLGGLGSSAFMADIDSMKHETQHSRIFRT